MLDLVAHRSVRDYRRALAPGRPVPVRRRAASHGAERPDVGAVVGRLSGRRIGVLAVNPARRTSARSPSGAWPARSRIHIDRTFTLDEVPEALAHVGEGRALGKVVVVPG